MLSSASCRNLSHIMCVALSAHVCFLLGHVCVGKQCEGSSSGERSACEAHAEKTNRGREEKSVQQVGHCIGFKAQEDAAGEPVMEQH